MSHYVPPKERRLQNRSAVYRVPEGIRLVPDLPPPKDTTMDVLAPAPSRLRWPVAVLVATAAALLGGLMLLPGGCKTTGDVPSVQDVGQIVADCTAPAVHDLAVSSLDDVASALVTTDYSGSIRAVVARIASEIASKAGNKALDVAWQAVRCAVGEVYDQTTVHLGYGRLDRETARREQMINHNAHAWLTVH